MSDFIGKEWWQTLSTFMTLPVFREENRGTDYMVPVGVHICVII